jgi:hypothetical protein
MAKMKIGKEAQDPVVNQNVHQDTPASPHIKPANFEAWWSLTQKKKKLNPAMKKAVEIYFERKGYLASGDFEAGLKEFGVV